MRVYLARQAIYDQKSRVTAYELFYRQSDKNVFDPKVEGSRATMSVVSDAQAVFGLDEVTGGKRAFINFTRQLLMDDFALVLDPDSVVVELLETIEPDDEVIARTKRLKERGYTLAIDDCVDASTFRVLFPFVDIIKVDFSLLAPEARSSLARQLLRREGLTLLAEKVETKEDYERAVADGYTLFQGYYFSRPVVMSKEAGTVAGGSCSRALRVLSGTDPDYDELAEIVRNDVTLSFRLLKYANTMRFYRGVKIDSVKTALLRMGRVEVRRWFTLMITRELMSASGNTPLANSALARGMFCESLARHIGFERYNDAFSTGIFSLIDMVMGEDIEKLVDSLCLPDDVRAALTGQNNQLRQILDFVIRYEQGLWQEGDVLLGKAPDMDDLANFYWDAVTYADEAFAEQ